MGNIPLQEEIQEICHQRFSREVYERMQQAKVAVAGLGGLGSHVAVMLTRSGIGKLKLVDFDKVELSNLNRQAYDIRHLGQKKTDALSGRLQEINPYIELETCDKKVTEENARDIFRGYTYVCEAFDSPEAKAMLAGQLLGERGREEKENVCLIAGSGMAGFGDANLIHTRKINNSFYICGDEQTDIAEGMGLMAPRVTICAGHQANKIIQLIVGGQEYEK